MIVSYLSVGAPVSRVHPLFLSVAGERTSLTVVHSDSNDDESTPADISAMIANPFYAIEFDPVLAAQHKPIISEDQWIEANVQLITEFGPEPYLRKLLATLKRHPDREHHLS